MSDTVLDIPVFRVVFSAYADDTIYPDSLLSYWYEIGKCYIKDNDCTLGEKCRAQALMAMLAHLLYLNDSSNAGNKPIVVQSATEGAVSISLTAPPISGQFEYWLNATPYGPQILAMLEIASAGGLMVGGSLDRLSFRKADGRF